MPRYFSEQFILKLKVMDHSRFAIYLHNLKCQNLVINFFVYYHINSFCYLYYSLYIYIHTYVCVCVRACVCVYLTV